MSHSVSGRRIQQLETDFLKDNKNKEVEMGKPLRNFPENKITVSPSNKL